MSVMWNKIKHSVGPKAQWVLDHTVRRKLSSKEQLIELLIIKYFYMFLAVLVLDQVWYVGYGSYGIRFTIQKEIVASAVFIAVCILYQKLTSSDGFLKQLMQCLFILYYIPVNSAFSINNTSWGFFLLSNVYFVLIIMAVWWISLQAETKWNRSAPQKRELGQDKYSNRPVNVLCFLVCCFFIIHKIHYNGFDFSLSIVSNDIYSSRASYADYLQEIGGTLYSYLLAVVRYSVTYIAPFYLLSSLLRRKPFGVVVSVFSILSMYAVSSEKSTLMMAMVVVFVYVLYRTDLLKHFDRIFSSAIILIMAVCFVEHVLMKSDMLYTLIIRREMYMPAWLNTLYYDFFSQNDIICWSQNVVLLQNIFDPVYAVSPLELISSTYFQGLVPSPNTGMFAEAYMHFGALGVIVYPVLLAIVFVLSGKVLCGYGHAVQMLMVFQLTMSLTNIPITRTDFVLSYILMVVILYVMPWMSVNKIGGYLKKIPSVLCRRNHKSGR